MKKGKWTFLTNHGRILAFIARYPRSTIQEVAEEAAITPRTVQRIIKELETEGYIYRNKIGRRNHYTVNVSLPMRHRLEREHAVGDILRALGYDPGRQLTGKEVFKRKPPVHK